MFLSFIFIFFFTSPFFSVKGENDEARKPPQNDFTPTGYRIAAWLENRIGNPDELGDRFESDINSYPGDGTSRNGIVGQRFRWPNAEIPFVISGNFTRNDMFSIARAVDSYHSNTCIRFREKTSNDKDYVDITSKNDGCYSNVGRSGGRQVLNLQTPGCTSSGIIIHEMMHACGFFHEHSRFDRDFFVKIMFRNIKQGQKHNFDRFNNTITTVFETLYDYDSIMHYDQYAFSVDPGNKPTIIPKRPGVNIGQRKGFSRTDIEKLRRMYNC